MTISCTRQTVARVVRDAGLVAALAALAGCSSLDLLSAVQPGPGVRVTRGLAYGEGPRRRLDVYAPAKRQEGRPVVVFFYGGSWQFGDRGGYAFVGKALAAHGYVTVVPDYRLYPEVRWPDFLVDSAQAVAWAKAHAPQYGGDPSRLVLMGHSAGGYNAINLAVDRRWLARVGLDPRRDVRAAVGLAGPYDFLPLTSEPLKLIFGPVADRRDTQPITHADGASPPLWLAAPKKDRVVDPGNATRLAHRVRAKGGRAETRFYPRVSHETMVGSIGAPLRFLAPVLADATAFIDRHTAADGRGLTGAAATAPDRPDADL